MSAEPDYDLLIVGAGLVGASLALGLSKLTGTSCKVGIIEALEHEQSANSSFDDRNLALSLSSKNIFNGLDLWQELTPFLTPIKAIHVSEQYRFSAVRMSADILALPALGYVLTARQLGQNLLGKLKQCSQSGNQAVDFICPASVINIRQDSTSVSVQIEKQGKVQELRSRLLVLADGTLSSGRSLLGFETREKDYQQSAIVSNIITERPHHHVAFERFNSQGPFALLPFGKNNCGMVFTVASDEHDKYMSMDDDDFLHSAQQRFGRRLGRFLKIGKRKSYPLRLLHVNKQYAGRCLLLGNAAHTIHPNMAQGFNLGLRDVAGLIEMIKTANQAKQDIGSEHYLQRYIEARQMDQDKVIKMTDGLGDVFYNDDILKSKARHLGMLLSDVSPFLKKQIMHAALGLKGKQPSLVRSL